MFIQRDLIISYQALTVKTLHLDPAMLAMEEYKKSPIVSLWSRGKADVESTSYPQTFYCIKKSL